MQKSLIIYSLDLGLRMRLFSLLQYIPHPYDDYYDYNDFEKKKLVVYGSIEDSTMSSGYWHRETGKCLGGRPTICNTSHEFQKKFFSRFDIQL